MKPEHRRLLVTCLDLQNYQRAADPPPTWQTWNVDAWNEEIEHGPVYAPTKWFGPMLNAERQRHLRAIADLEQEGLIVTWRRCGGKLTNIQLTPAGERLAKSLAAETASTERTP